MPTGREQPGHQGHGPDVGEEDTPEEHATPGGTAPQPPHPLGRAWEFIRRAGLPQEQPPQQPVAPQLSDQERRDQEETNRVREQLGIAQRGVIESKAKEAAKETVAKERRGLAFWKKLTPSYFSIEQRRAQYLREHELRRELRGRAQAGEALTAAEQKQLEQLEENLKAGEGVELTPSERRFYDDFQKALATQRGRLEADEQQLKDRLEAGKFIEYMRAHPNIKAGLITAGIAGLAVVSFPLLGVLGPVAMAIKGGIAGAVGGGLAKEARVHSPLEWARDLGLSIRDEKLKTERFKTADEFKDMPTQELSEAVGVLKNVIEERKVTGSRGEFLRMWMLYREANDVLVEKSQHLSEKPTTGEYEKEGQFMKMTEAIKAKAKSTEEYDRMLRDKLSTDERKTYVSMQKGKGKQEWGAAVLGGTIGFAVGGLAGLWWQHLRAEQAGQEAGNKLVEQYHALNQHWIQEQHRFAVEKSSELAKHGIQALGMNPDQLTTFTHNLATGTGPEQLITDAGKFNIDLSVQVDGTRFADYLSGHAQEFARMPLDWQREALSHPDLAPALLKNSVTAVTSTTKALLGLGGVLLGIVGITARTHLERAGIRQKRGALGLRAEPEAYAEKAERERKEQTEAEREDRLVDFRKRIAEKGYRFEYQQGDVFWKVVEADIDPISRNWAVEVARKDGKGTKILSLDELFDLFDKKGATLVSFGKPEKTEEKKAEEKEKPKREQAKPMTEEEAKKEVERTGGIHKVRKSLEGKDVHVYIALTDKGEPWMVRGERVPSEVWNLIKGRKGLIHDDLEKAWDEGMKLAAEGDKGGGKEKGKEERKTKENNEATAPEPGQI